MFFINTLLTTKMRIKSITMCVVFQNGYIHNPVGNLTIWLSNKILRLCVQGATFRKDGYLFEDKTQFHERLFFWALKKVDTAEEKRVTLLLWGISEMKWIHKHIVVYFQELTMEWVTNGISVMHICMDFQHLCVKIICDTKRKRPCMKLACTFYLCIGSLALCLLVL